MARKVVSSMEQLTLATAALDAWTPRSTSGWVTPADAGAHLTDSDVQALVTACAEGATVINATQFEKLVCLVAMHQGLDFRWQCYIGKTIYGRRRKVDVVLRHAATGHRLAVECKFQDSSGTTDEKLPYAVLNQKTLPIPGVIVFGGKGWSDGALPWLCANAQATDLANWEDWVRFFFGV
jgi:hypothetical protein